MSPQILLWLAVGGLTVTALSGMGVKVLHDFSRHELEVFCRRRGNSQLYQDVLTRHDYVALGAESLQTLGVTVAVLAGAGWMLPVVADGAVTWNNFLAATVCVSFLLLALTSWIPWAVVEYWSAPFLFHTWKIWRIVSAIMWPLTVGVRIFDAVVRRLAGRDEEEDDEEEAFEDEIRAIVNSGMRDGLLEEDAREMIDGVMELGDEVVSGIMTPRSDINAFDVSLSWSEVLAFVIETGRTRIPVFNGSLDDIVGVLYVKDLLPELAKNDPSKRRSVRELLREPWRIPATLPVDDLLQEFLELHIHLAVVVDEYSGVAGVVTIEDVIEEIVGEIRDESDKEEDEEFHKIDDRTFEVAGKAHLDDINERLGLALPESDVYDTIAGFVIAKLGYIPECDELIESAGARIVVVEADRRRIRLVRIERLEESRKESA